MKRAVRTGTHLSCILIASTVWWSALISAPPSRVMTVASPSQTVVKPPAPLQLKPLSEVHLIGQKAPTPSITKPLGPLAKLPLKPAKYGKRELIIDALKQYRQSGSREEIAKEVGGMWKRFRQATEVVRRLAHPIEGIKKTYKQVLNRFVYSGLRAESDFALMRKAENKVIDALGGKEELMKDPDLQKMQGFLDMYKRYWRRDIAKLAERLIDGNLRRTLNTVNNRYVAPIMARTYKVPLPTFFYSLFLIDHAPDAIKIDPSYVARVARISPEKMAQRYQKKYFKKPFQLLGMDTEPAMSLRHMKEYFVPALMTIVKAPSLKEARTKLTTLRDQHRDIATDHKDIVQSLHVLEQGAFASLQISIAQSLQGIIDSYYEKEAEEVEVTEFLTNMKEELLPRFLLVHFEGRKLPGTDILVTEKNLDVAIEKIQEFGKKMETFAQAATDVYNAYVKLYKIYTLTNELVDAVATTMELTQQKVGKDYYTRLFGAMDTYMKVFDDILDVLDIDENDMGLTAAFAERLPIPGMFKEELLRSEERRKRRITRKRAAYALRKPGAKPSPLIQSLGALRYFTRLYRGFHDTFLKVFVREIDETGKPILKIKKEQLLMIAGKVAKDVIMKKVLAGWLLNVLKRKVRENYGPGFEMFLDQVINIGRASMGGRAITPEMMQPYQRPEYGRGYETRYEEEYETDYDDDDEDEKDYGEARGTPMAIPAMSLRF